MKAMKMTAHNLLKQLVGARGFEQGASCVTGRGAVVIAINSDRCGVFGTYWGGVLVAEA
jgi:hypothetical protein